jgi:hypothetical protein
LGRCTGQVKTSCVLLAVTNASCALLYSNPLKSVYSNPLKSAVTIQCKLSTVV